MLEAWSIVSSQAEWTGLVQAAEGIVQDTQRFGPTPISSSGFRSQKTGSEIFAWFLGIRLTLPQNVSPFPSRINLSLVHLSSCSWDFPTITPLNFRAPYRQPFCLGGTTCVSLV